MTKNEIKWIAIIVCAYLAFNIIFWIRIPDNVVYTMLGIWVVFMLLYTTAVLVFQYICSKFSDSPIKIDYFSDAEKEVISGFMTGEREKRGKAFVLKWSDGGEALARYEHCMEDYNEYFANDARFEEYWVLVFTLIHKVSDTGSIEAKRDEKLHITYKNFPEEIKLASES